MPLSADGWFEDAATLAAVPRRSVVKVPQEAGLSQFARPLGFIEPPQPRAFTSETTPRPKTKPTPYYVVQTASDFVKPLGLIEPPQPQAFAFLAPRLPRTRPLWQFDIDGSMVAYMPGIPVVEYFDGATTPHVLSRALRARRDSQPSQEVYFGYQWAGGEVLVSSQSASPPMPLSPVRTASKATWQSEAFVAGGVYDERLTPPPIIHVNTPPLRRLRHVVAGGASLDFDVQAIIVDARLFASLWPSADAAAAGVGKSRASRAAIGGGQLDTRAAFNNGFDYILSWQTQPFWMPTSQRTSPVKVPAFATQIVNAVEFGEVAFPIYVSDTSLPRVSHRVVGERMASAESPTFRVITDAEIFAPMMQQQPQLEVVRSRSWQSQRSQSDVICVVPIGVVIVSGPFAVVVGDVSVGGGAIIGAVT